MIYRLAPFIMIVAIFILLTIIIVNLMKYRLRKKMVESRMMDESFIASSLPPQNAKSEKRNILKYSLLFIFGGAGLIFQEFLPYSAETSILPYGVEIMSIAIGMLIYYLIIRKDTE